VLYSTARGPPNLSSSNQVQALQQVWKKRFNGTKAYKFILGFQSMRHCKKWQHSTIPLTSSGIRSMMISEHIEEYKKCAGPKPDLTATSTKIKQSQHDSVYSKQRFSSSGVETAP